MSDESRDRLPSSTVPSAYRLSFSPDLDAATFTGCAEIDVTLDAPTPVVELNAVDLELRDVTARLPDGTTIVATVELDAQLERATLRFDGRLPAGPVVLRAGFEGVLNDRLIGFYRSTFTDADGVARTIATTQLAITDARRMFPCFDEPAFKATFELTCVVPSDLAAFSNSPVATERARSDGRREVTFLPTMPMSTYLVALVVGPFERSEVLEVDGTPLSVVTTPGNARMAGLALEAGAFALRFYAEYFGIPYPGDKLDLVGIPDFAYGAMENLGCVTFRETRLLVDPSTASTIELQDVAMVVAHELAHMWFGDLVTMAWWEGIWLNEAFATYMQYVCTDAFRPEWHVWIRFGQEREVGLAIDALHSTRPIEYPVHSPSDAIAMIDVITYSKGAAVLRMLEQYLGAAAFRDGIRRYLAAHAYANTVTTDLWDALEAASGEPVADIMDTWILQGGHPIVTLRDDTLTQAPFKFRAPDGPSAIGRTWRIPLRVRRLREGAAVTQLLDDEPQPLVVASPAIVNAGGSGVYRTSYDAASLAAVAGELGLLSELERAVLLADTWALARAGTRGVGDVLTIAGGLGPVVEPTAWAVVGELLTTLDRIVTERDRPALQSAATALLAPLLDTLGWDPKAEEDERTPIVRALAVRGLGCVAREAEVRTEAARRFDDGALSGDLAAAVIAVVGAMGRAQDPEVMRRRHRDAKDPQEEERYRIGLAMIASRDHCVATFDACFELFRVQDAANVIAALLRNPCGGTSVWEALRARWDETIARFPPVLQRNVCAGIVSFIADRGFAERVAAFHLSHPLEQGHQHVVQFVEQMLDGVDFAERARPGLGVALR
jgi:puromycin-sensitive aminopeptidase